MYMYTMCVLYMYTMSVLYTWGLDTWLTMYSIIIITNFNWAVTYSTCIYCMLVFILAFHLYSSFVNNYHQISLVEQCSLSPSLPLIPLNIGILKHQTMNSSPPHPSQEVVCYYNPITKSSMYCVIKPHSPMHPLLGKHGTDVKTPSLGWDHN